MPFTTTTASFSTRQLGGLGGTLISGFVFNDVIRTSMTAYNLRTRAIAAGWNQTAPLQATVVIQPQVTISNSLSTGNLSANSLVTIINGGQIYGQGGVGGSGGVGGNGSDAIIFGTNARGQVINAGTIGGGGGGGGSGANFIASSATVIGGSGGGGGQGSIGGIGGAGVTGSNLNGNRGADGTVAAGGQGGPSASLDAPDEFSIAPSVSYVTAQNNLVFNVTLNRTTYGALTVQIPYISTITGVPSGTATAVFTAISNQTTISVAGSGASSGGTITTNCASQGNLIFTGAQAVVNMFPLRGVQSAAGCYSAQGGFALETDSVGTVWLRMGVWPSDPPNCQTADWNWLRNNFATNDTRRNNNSRPYWTQTWSLNITAITVGSSAETRAPSWPYTLVSYTYSVQRTATNSITISIYPNAWGTGDTGTSISVSNWWNNVNAITPLTYSW